MSGNSSRKGTPIQSPFSKRQNEKLRANSSHDYLSPLNTLDAKLPPKKYKNPLNKYETPLSLSKSYSNTFPIKTDKLPGAFNTTTTSAGYNSFKTLLQKYPSDTFCTEMEALSSVTKNHVNVVLSDSDSEDDRIVARNPLEDCFDIKSSCYSKSEIKRKPLSTDSFFDFYVPEPSPKSSMNAPLNSFIKPRPFPTLTVSNVQYRSIMLPNSSKDDPNLKLIFVPNERIVSLLNSKNNTVTIPFSKISRVQFIRNESLASSDWYIDFVLNCNSLDLEPFGIFPNFSTAEAIAFQDCNTLRINLAINCGLSIISIESLLIPILRDRSAFYFTSKRDPYGEFEKTNNSSNSSTASPIRQLTPTSKTPHTRNVPSLEALSSSDSVKISSSAIKRSSNSIFQSHHYSPDIFTKRTSKRLRSSQESPKKATNSSQDSVYIDPNFETERVILFTYPEGELDSVYVTSHELERLAPKIWLNDTNIDFELKFLFSQLNQELQDKIHIFSSFFYRRLSSAKLSLLPSQDGTKTGFDLVKSWTRKVDLFEKDFLIVPICENLHWFLAIICHPSKMLAEEIIEDDLEKDTKGSTFDSEVGVKEGGVDDFEIKLAHESEEQESPSQFPSPFVDLDPEPIDSTKIFIFDSLGLASRGKGVAVINRLRTYLQLEADDKLKRKSSKSACIGHVIKVPQQENYTDCGCFLLQFAEEFILSIPNDIVNKIQEHNNDMSNWFPSSVAQSRRDIMRKRVEQLAQDFAHREKLKNGSTPPPEEQHEDRSSDIEEILLLPPK